MEKKKIDSFCTAYLKCMDADRAAGDVGLRTGGTAALSDGAVREKIEEMRSAAVSQICREDVIRRLCQLAFSRTNDGIRLAMGSGGEMVNELDLSSVAEFKCSEKGMEIKFVDRVKALETLYSLLCGGNDTAALGALFDALDGEGE